jgi:Holliday junction resolvase RusA-like endonuclease
MKSYTFTVPMKPAGKERPRFSNGNTYMPAKYMKWKKDFIAYCFAYGNFPSFQALKCPICFSVTFCTKTGKMRPDIDNAVGACLDAIQDTKDRRGLIANDRQVIELHARVCEGLKDEIMFTLQEVQ